MNRSKIAAIVLAAGSSRRMGTTKQLLPLGQMTMLQKVISNLAVCQVKDIFVVLGHEAESIRPLLVEYPITVLFNEIFYEGMSTSIKCGLRSLENSCGSILLALGDQPFIPSHVTNRLIRAYLNSDKGIAYPTHNGQRGHPVILSRKYEAEMWQLTGDNGCKQILEAHTDDHLALEVEEEGVLWDIDYPTDYSLRGQH